MLLISPKVGSLLVAAEPSEFYDIALPDFGLLLGALTLNRLATAFGATTIAREV